MRNVQTNSTVRNIPDLSTPERKGFNRTGVMRALHGQAKKIGFTHDDLRDLASSLFTIPRDKVSLAKLTNYQLSRFLDHLKHESRATSNHKDPSKKTPENQNLAVVKVPNAATNRQLYKIQQLAVANEMLPPGNPAHYFRSSPRLEGFIARQCHGKTSLRNLTIHDAQLVIDGLKNLAQRCTPSAE